MNEKLKKFIKNEPLFSVAEAEKNGIQRSLLAYYCKKGEIEKLGRGLYKVAGKELDIPIQWEDLLYAYKKVPNSTVCLLSALAIYNMTDEFTKKHWLAIDHSRYAAKKQGIKIIRLRNTKLGKTSMNLGKYKISIFDRERTVIDAFRFLSVEVAIKAIQAYFKSGMRPDYHKLSDYAQKLHVDIAPYVLTLTT
ncbi:MAG: AbiEi antitoxin N-terminal domain-containing protein [Deltaproteobacteria bacterium]|nr:AbiEi antitoxin N-terminal domain-containing protein [Deltaproteobacteria bacterium]